MSAPTRAVVLAAGYGTRLLPLTRNLPKALVPLWGVPMLEHVLRLLRDWGVQDVLINCHAHADQIVEATRRLNHLGLRLNLSYEPVILGTGGVLRQASWFLGKDPFWMINADVAADLDPTPLLNPKSLASLWMHPGIGPRTVALKRGFVTNFASPNPGSKGTATFCGLHLVSPKILKYIPEGFSSIVTAYQHAMKDGHRIRGVIVPGATWADIGTPEQYLDAHATAPGGRVPPGVLRKTKGGARPPGALQSSSNNPLSGDPFAAIDPSATVHKHARVEDAVIWPNAHLGPRAVARRVIVGPNTRLNHQAERIVLPAVDALDEPELRALETLDWDPIKVTAECLSPRSGSARSFVRLHRRRKSMMLVRYDPAREENTLYASHARHLRQHGVNVPAVLCDRPKDQFTIFEDAGRDSLLDLVKNAAPKAIVKRYRTVLDQVHKLHHTPTRGIQLMEPFSPALYHWEHNLFAEHCLNNETPALRAAVLKDLRKASRELHRLPKVLLHRDLQSSNIHFMRGEPVLIDFQGMRLGPAAYDLASLLCDPYVALPLSIQLELLSHCPTTATDAFWWAAIQRLAQALGAYGRLSALPGGKPENIE